MISKHENRSGIDRRSGNDRRRNFSRESFDMMQSRRQNVERREESNEIRTGWVKVSKYSSTYLGVPINKLKQGF